MSIQSIADTIVKFWDIISVFVGIFGLGTLAAFIIYIVVEFILFDLDDFMNDLDE